MLSVMRSVIAPPTSIWVATTVATAETRFPIQARATSTSMRSSRVGAAR